MWRVQVKTLLSLLVIGFLMGLAGAFLVGGQRALGGALLTEAMAIVFVGIPAWAATL
jgi:hypothetical protein